VEVDPDRPVLVDKYLDRADELDVDALCDKDGNVVICGIMQHIEQAGVHSGAFPHPSSCYHALQYACPSRALSWRRGRGNINRKKLYYFSCFRALHNACSSSVPPVPLFPSQVCPLTCLLCMM
jgi:hypothetical protein